MRFAAIETSTEWCSVALWSDGEIAALERRAGHRHRVRLCLLERPLHRKDLAQARFRRRPRRFTGLRIACALAQGLAFARSLPVIGISTLEALAQESGAERVVACIDARMREVYYAALEKRAGRWHEAIAAQCVAPQSAPRPRGEGWVAG
jgi:tRNA threonylcarbamoyladenosine biosynthesis protein TsaB